MTPPMPNECRDPAFAAVTSLPGLQGPATVLRDANGMAHVDCTTEHDAFFLQGFITAADRMFSMDAARRKALGTQAELMGNAFVGEDKLLRTMGVPESCSADWEETQKIGPVKNMFDAFTDGVNAFTEWGRANGGWGVEYAELGVEPEKWEPHHCIAASKSRHALLGVFQYKLFRARLAATLPPELFSKIVDAPRQTTPTTILSSGFTEGWQASSWTSTLDSVKEFKDAIAYAVKELVGVAGSEPAPGGSNIWNLTGVNTSTGTPLLSGDPHRETECPNMYFPIRIRCPDWDITGLTFSGAPGWPHFAHNADVAWAITHGMASKEDLYLEKLPTPETYLSKDGTVKPLSKTVQKIAVRGEAPVEITVLATDNGPLLIPPVLAENGSTHFALSIKNTSTFKANTQLACHYNLLRAKNSKEALDAMRGWVEPAGNFTVADKHNIGYINRGCYPLRNVANLYLPVPGWDPEYSWQGEIPFEELPRIEEPVTGKVIHANNPIVGNEYKHGLLSVDYSMVWRVEEIRKTIDAKLASGGKWSPEDTRQLHADTFSKPASTFVGLIKDKQLSGKAEEMRQKMLSWNCWLTADSVEAHVYQVWRRKLVGSLFETGEKLAPFVDGVGCRFEVGANKVTRMGMPENGNIWNAVAFLAEQRDTAVLKDGETWEDRAASSFAAAVDWFVGTHGADESKWPSWGSVHVLQAKHPLTGKIDGFLGSGALDSRRVPMGGDGDTVQAAPGFHSVTALSVCRYAINPADWESSLWVIPFGVSGHRASPHFEDQLATYEKHQMLKWAYDWDGVEKVSKSKVQFVPA